MKYLLAAIVLIVVGALADADCVVRSRVVQSYAYAPAYIATYVPYAVQVPTYSIGFGQDNSALNQKLDLLIQEMRIQNSLMKKAQGGGAEERPAYLQVFNNRCAKCHEQSVAKANGNGFVLLVNGELPKEMDSADVLAISFQIAKGTMPKGSQGLPREEQLIVQEWVGAVAASMKQPVAKKE